MLLTNKCGVDDAADKLYIRGSCWDAWSSESWSDWCCARMSTSWHPCHCHHWWQQGMPQYSIHLMKCLSDCTAHVLIYEPKNSQCLENTVIYKLSVVEMG